MIPRLVRAWSVLLVTAVASTLAAEELPFRLVVHETNPVAPLTAKEVAKIFQKRTTHWDSEGQVKIKAVDREHRSRVRQDFSLAVFGKTAAAMHSFWARQVFSGRTVPPTQLSSDLEVLHFVRDNPGAIGYVSAEVSLVEGVRSLRISDVPTVADTDPAGVSGVAPAAFGADSRHGTQHDVYGARSPARRDSTEVVAERGQVRILLTGSCGPDAQGREAVLEHRDRHATVRVAIETASWSGTRFSSSDRETYTLSGHEEKRLGCTKASGEVERRFSLAEVSDNSVRVHPRRERGAPSRDFIALVGSGTCGRGGQGQRVKAVNQHRERSILVFVERVERLNGDFRNRSVKTYRLGPGAEKELGCSRDGNLALEFGVLEAD